MAGFFHVFAVRGGWFALLLVAGALPAAGSSVMPARTVSALIQRQEAADAPARKLSPQECLDEANRMSGTWDGKLKTVQQLLAAAKKTKNVIRQNCIEPKLKDVQFGIDEGRATVADMKQGMRGTVNADRMELLLQKVRVIDSNIEESVMEAGRCIGDEQFSSGEGFELKASHPDEVPFDPDSAPVILDHPLGNDNSYMPVNPDWSVEMTWPNASPYK